MYLIIFEDGSITKTTEINSDHIQGHNDGYLDIVDIADSDHPKEYIDNKWGEVDSD